ncbi:hypothetical protein ACFO0N_18445 [Halobium salinum]|uniref:Caspase domain-containing protein n=1 Tax=Halobium salinum TaxID=1364940 RepID=A0ABD5PHK7_9EURY|nr:hypothetical protein [Halobium salinum]
MTVEFSSDGDAGLLVTDAVERRQCTLLTPGPVDSRPAGSDAFRFPVDAAVAVETGSLTLPSVVATFVRDASGEMLADVDHFERHEFEAGRYGVELSAPIKLYLLVEGPMVVETTGDTTTVERDGDGAIRVGARSFHDHPAGTITTTADPHDAMTAVSALSSSLKTTSPERSFPSLRGHPPTIELGESLSVPEELTPPDTGVRIEVPPRLQNVYTVAPLAFYLGARVEPGATPRLVTDDGFEHALDGPRGFPETVARTLKQVFFLDCVVRTEGLYTVSLHERRAVEEAVDLDFAALYERSLPEQLAAYLSVPFAVLEEHVPDWKQTTRLDPTPENVELLPFLVNDLAVVLPPEGRSVTPSEAQMAAIDAFTRDDRRRHDAHDTRDTADPLVRSATGATSESAGRTPGPSLVQPAGTDSLEQVWAGADAPVGASKASVRAFRNRLERGPTDGDIDIVVVCNDDAMDEEGDVAERVYGSRDTLPFDVQVYHDLSTAALRAVLETEVDFLHYIGHIDDAGFDCADGKLDVTGLDRVGVGAFFLNACRSYGQGMALLERGAVGGVVTLTDVINSGAVRVGKTMARLLNAGFPLRPALDISKGRSIVGGQYTVVGDGNADIVQSDSRSPVVLDLDVDPDGEIRATPHLYPTRSHGMGSFAGVPLGDEGVKHLVSGPVDSFSVSEGELRSVLSVEELPVRCDGELHWSQTFDFDLVR